MLIGRSMFAAPGVASGGVQVLDQPLNNFDTAGIPTGAWSSPLFGCFSNIIPSCVLSFCCPCVLWAQVVTRSQVPLMISLKNSLPFIQKKSGYGFFIDFFNFTLLVGGGLLFVVIFFQDSLSSGVSILLGIFAVALLAVFLYLMAHVRMAFKEKYLIPPLCFPTAGLPENMMESMVAIFCLPCSLSQMARHVFQYDRWDPPIGLFIPDPYSLDALEAQTNRPMRADQAGLSTLPHNYVQQTNAQQGVSTTAQTSQPLIVSDDGTPQAPNTNTMYNADGTVFGAK